VVCQSAGDTSTPGVTGSTTRSFQKCREVITSQLSSVSAADDHLEKDSGTELNLASISFLIMLLHDEPYGKVATPA
jgi:hypothetical protein